MTRRATISRCPWRSLRSSRPGRRLMGVLRAVEQPTVDQLAREQEREAEKATKGRATLEALLPERRHLGRDGRTGGTRRRCRSSNRGDINSGLCVFFSFPTARDHSGSECRGRLPQWSARLRGNSLRDAKAQIRSGRGPHHRTGDVEVVRQGSGRCASGWASIWAHAHRHRGDVRNREIVGEAIEGRRDEVVPRLQGPPVECDPEGHAARVRAVPEAPADGPPRLLSLALARRAPARGDDRRVRGATSQR